MIRLGIAGAGFIFRQGYAPHLGDLGRIGAGLTAIYDPDPGARAAAARDFPDVHSCDDLDSMLDRIDVLIVANPNHTHLATALPALRRGIHCLVEKPAVTTLAEVAQLEAGLCASPAWLSAAAVCRWREDVIAWLEMCRRLGRLERLRLLWRRHRGAPAGRVGWNAAGGVFPDLGYHLTDLAGACLGWPGVEPAGVAVRRRLGACAPASWYGAAEAAADAREVEFDVQLSCRIETAVLEIDVSWSDETPGDITRLEAWGAGGRSVLEGLFGYSTERRLAHQRCTLYTPDGAVAQVREFTPGPGLHRAAFGRMLAAFIEDARAGGPFGGTNDIRFSAALLEAAA